MNIKDKPFSERYYKQETLKDLAKQLNYYYRKFGLGKEKLMDSTKWTPRLVQTVFVNEREAESYIKDLELDSKYKGIDITKATRGKSVTNEMKSINKDIANYLKTYNKYSDTKLTMKEFREKTGNVKSAYYMAENAKLKAELNKIKNELVKRDTELATKVQEAIDNKVDNSKDLSDTIKEKNALKQQLERIIEREKVREQQDRKIYENNIFKNIKNYQDQATRTIDWYLEHANTPVKNQSKYNLDFKRLENVFNKMLGEISELNDQQIADNENALELDRYSEINYLFKTLKTATRLNARSNFKDLNIIDQLDEINEMLNLPEQFISELKETLTNTDENNIIEYIKKTLLSSPSDLINKVDKSKDINDETSKGVVEINYSEGASATVSESEFVLCMESGWYVLVKYKDLKITDRRTNELLKNFQKETGSSFQADQKSKYSMFYKWLIENYQTLLINQGNSIITTNDKVRLVTLPDTVDSRRVYDLSTYLKNYKF